jgi:hypothetical protein
MKNLYLLLFFPLFLLTITACSVSQEEAEKQALAFYEVLKNRNYDDIKPMIDEEGLKAAPWENWKALLVQKEALGQLISFEREDGYNVGYQDGLSYADLYFTVTYEKVVIFEFIRMAKRENDYRIITYSYYDNKDRRTEFVQSLK